MIIIKERWEYDYCVSRGANPLLDPSFEMDINLRVAIQQELFGRGVFGKDVMKANDKFFRWCWVHMKHICEETMQPLKNYSAVHCSHILTRGAFPEMATDPRNINLLTFEAHNQWENGDRTKMRIYEKNERIIEKLKREYNVYKRR